MRRIIPLLLLIGMLAVSGWAVFVIEPFSPELVKKAEAGNAMAQCSLGSCYLGGKGITQDYKEAVKWFTKSVEQGDAMAQGLLGFCYLEGKGVTQDYKEAVKWFTKAAEQGNADAKEELEKLKSK